MSKYFIVAALAITGFFFNHTPVVEAAIPAGGVELQGFAWSAYRNPVTGGREGVGWISMNCLSGGACGTIPYGVSVESDGNLTGFAWSSVGYIKFNPDPTDLTGAPTAAGSARATNPASYPNLSFTGWARACAVYAIGCSGALKPPSALGGWDGWISLNGSSPAYGVEMTSTGATPTSYAWGGPVVMGWIDFSPDASATGVTIPPVTYVVSAPDVTITAPTTLDQLMGSFDIEFNPLGSGHAPDSCTVSDGSVTAPITLNSPVTAAERVTVSLNADTTYTIECTNAGGPGSDSISINVLYDLVVGGVSVVPGPLNAAGDAYSTVDVTFSVSGVPVGATGIDHTVTLDGAPADAEFDAAGASAITTSFTNVPYGASVPYTVQVDMRTSYPTDGEILETDEFNEVTGTTDLLVAPDPVITIDVPEIVATDTEVPVNIEITGTPEAYTCRVVGPGLDATPFNSEIGVNLTYTYTDDTSPLTNATTIAVRCAIPTGGEFTESATIDVIPGFQEI